MKCAGCGDTHIVHVAYSIPLCLRCCENTYTGGELGDLEQELVLLSDFEMEVTRDGGPSPAFLEAAVIGSEAPDHWRLEDLVADDGRFQIE